MKIKSVTIKNFRGYNRETTITFDNLTVFVGKNDVGKSTVLEALDIFFNDGKGVVKIDKDDVNAVLREENDQETVITVTFTDLPISIVIDTAVETCLASEYMLNEEGDLEVTKKYKNGGAAKVFIKANHPSNPECADLLLKKNAELKRIVQNNGIECTNNAVNSVLRAAIWNHYSENLLMTTQEIDVTKEDAKKIWDKLATYLPTYSLFQADRKNTDGDNEIQDPLKEAVKQILTDQEIQSALELVATTVETKLREVSSRTLDKLREMDANIADSLNPVIPTSSALKWADVFKSVSISGDNSIPINKRGSGVKRLVLLNFFRAEAERRAHKTGDRGVVYAIEEPETSQHSANQRMLIEAFKSLAALDNSQVMLTSHSAFLVKQLDFSNLRLIVENEEGIKEIRSVLPGQLQYPSLNEVNYLAFDEVTEEYHDELWSYIEFQQWKSEYIEGQSTRPYNQILRDGSIQNRPKVLSEYIRHKIHHPENHENPNYTLNELRESIDLMRAFISHKMETSGFWEP